MFDEGYSAKLTLSDYTIPEGAALELLVYLNGLEAEPLDFAFPILPDTTGPQSVSWSRGVNKPVYFLVRVCDSSYPGGACVAPAALTGELKYTITFTLTTASEKTYIKFLGNNPCRVSVPIPVGMIASEERPYIQEFQISRAITQAGGAGSSFIPIGAPISIPDPMPGCECPLWSGAAAGQSCLEYLDVLDSCPSLGAYYLYKIEIHYKPEKGWPPSLLKRWTAAYPTGMSSESPFCPATPNAVIIQQILGLGSGASDMNGDSAIDVADILK